MSFAKGVREIFPQSFLFYQSHGVGSFYFLVLIESEFPPQDSLPMNEDYDIST
jgi:hypothetical protein